MVALSSVLLAASGALGSLASGTTDTSSLVQEAVQAHRLEVSTERATGGLMLDRALALASLGKNNTDFMADFTAAIAKSVEFIKKPFPFNCKVYPKLCQEPFNCQDGMSFEQLDKVALFGAATEGKANLKIWCLVPHYQNYMSSCLQEKDLKKAAQVQYKWTQHIPPILELDASYCFLEGHCSNMAVTENTTLEESYQMCDDRFGHDYWTKAAKIHGSGTWESALHMLKPGAVSGISGFHDPEITKMFLIAACAMGNYHCDVVYCKETYCQKPEYIAKYGHLLPRARGDLVQELTRF